MKNKINPETTTINGEIVKENDVKIIIATLEIH